MLRTLIHNSRENGLGNAYCFGPHAQSSAIKNKFLQKQPLTQFVLHLTRTHSLRGETKGAAFSQVAQRFHFDLRIGTF